MPCPVLHIKQPQHRDEGGHGFQLHLGCQVQCVAVQDVDHPVLRADHQHADLYLAETDGRGVTICNYSIL